MQPHTSRPQSAPGLPETCRRRPVVHSRSRLPFTNNVTERAVRMPRIKRKISGCFRAIGVTGNFCVIRSCLDRLRKQGHSMLKVLQRAFAGNLAQPLFMGRRKLRHAVGFSRPPHVPQTLSGWSILVQRCPSNTSSHLSATTNN
nr:transposase [Massilia genomosp. 1]